MSAHRTPRSLTTLWISAGATGVMLAACGGGGGEAAAPAPAPVAVSQSSTFPTGLAVGTPGDLQAAPATIAAVGTGWRTTKDWGRALWNVATGHGRPGDLARMATAAMPVERAHAAPALLPDTEALADKIKRVLDGDTSIDLATLLDLQDLFAASGNAQCYGPSMAYASHQDAGAMPPSGTLPSGDLGIWLEYENGTQPCVAAQLKARTRSVRGQATQGLLMTALMRNTIATSSSLTMPSAGGSTDARVEVQTRLNAVPGFSGIVVAAATVALDSTGSTYTYRLALLNGLTGVNAREGEVIIRHTKGSGPTVFDGVMQVAGFTLSSDSAFGCEDAKDVVTGLYQVSHVSTVKYSRNGADMSYGGRNAHYCGHPSSILVTDWGAAVASLTSGYELDPSAKLSGNTRGTSTGWRGNFSRFAAAFDKSDGAGNFLYAWQAGPMDNATRMLAINADYNSATDTRTLSGYFGFGADIASSDGTMQGMICNWAGPGNSHTPQASFQSQVATQSGSATGFTIASGGSKITYAPTNSCTSTTTSFDADIDGTLAAGEGVGTASGLDAPTGTNTVQQELQARGFSLPGLF